VGDARPISIPCANTSHKAASKLQLILSFLYYDAITKLWRFHFMKYKKRVIASTLSLVLLVSLCACSQSKKSDTESTNENQETSKNSAGDIEATLNLANNEDQEWAYSKDADAWVLSVVSAVAYPELPDQQGVSVCVPGTYVTGIDTDGDGKADVATEDATEAVKGSLIIDHEAKITSTNGQIYTAETAPVILNTGAAGYGSQENSAASTTYAADGYINISCGNRGKQDTVTDEEGTSIYTGDAPSCLVDQKAAARYVKYNILLGNLPGSVDYFVSTGGSGGGAHAAMFAATSNNSDYYDYQIEAGAVGVYKNEDGTYSTTVTIDDADYELSDGAWGSIAYSAITSLYEADMTMAFEYYMDAAYEFNTPFQTQLAEYLSTAYMEYINAQNLSVEESAVGFDLNKDGDTEDTIPLSIQYDLAAHPETNGYYGTYLDLYLAEFTENLQWYLDNLDYGEGWTWFDENGTALSNEAVAAMTSAEKATAFIEGRYTKGSTDKGAGMGNLGNGQMPDGMKDGEKPSGDMPSGEKPSEKMSQDTTELADSDSTTKDMEVGTPDGGTTQSSTSGTDSANYETYTDMVNAYKADIESIDAGDEYKNNIVSLYNPLEYIGAEDTENPTWTKIIMGASEGDMSMFSSLNLQIAWLNAGVDAQIEWQWDGGHVPSETLGNSFSLYVDQMYGEHVENATAVTKAAASPQTENGTATEATGTSLSSWVNSEDIGNISFTLADAAAYRTAGASKATPGFDVIDYGQEDYVFGNMQADARHWNTFLLEVFEEHADVLEPLFNTN
jgi:hypothetical protein